MPVVGNVEQYVETQENGSILGGIERQSVEVKQPLITMSAITVMFLGDPKHPAPL